jgi:hypothetical protein
MNVAAIPEAMPMKSRSRSFAVPVVVIEFAAASLDLANQSSVSGLVKLRRTNLQVHHK